MEIKPGFVYHIEDSYFDSANDPNLMCNKEDGNKRPTYCCISDTKTSLLWMVPMSTKIDKYQTIADRSVERYGECLGIVIGKFDGKKSAFLLQNMFPVIPKYVSHIHSRNGNPIPVSQKTMREIEHKAAKIMGLLRRGKKVIFTDVKDLEKRMIYENQQEKQVNEKLIDKDKSINTPERSAKMEDLLKESKQILNANPQLKKKFEELFAEYFKRCGIPPIGSSAPQQERFRVLNAIIASDSAFKAEYINARNSFRNSAPLTNKKPKPPKH